MSATADERRWKTLGTDPSNLIIEERDVDENERDRAYYVGRMFASLKAAQRATDGFVRLIHLDLAGRYSVAATRLLAAGQPERCDKSYISASSFASRAPA